MAEVGVGRWPEQAPSAAEQPDGERAALQLERHAVALDVDGVVGRPDVDCRPRRLADEQPVVRPGLAAEPEADDAGGVDLDGQRPGLGVEPRPPRGPLDQPEVGHGPEALQVKLGLDVHGLARRSPPNGRRPYLRHKRGGASSPSSTLLPLARGRDLSPPDRKRRRVTHGPTPAPATRSPSHLVSLKWS